MYPDYISAKKMRENYEGNVFSCMGCRSFLTPWKDENGEYKFEGRFNQGVVSINLPQIAIIAQGDEEKFWTLLEETMILSALWMVERRWAITIEVRPCNRELSASWTSFSLSVSRAEVASSRIRISGFLSTARAMLRRWR